MSKIAALDTTQSAQYATLYERFMTNTEADRDELRAMRERMRDARSDPSTAMQQMDAVREATDRLRKQQKAFDENLQSLLKKEQWKTYDKWRKNARKQMEETERPEWGRP